MQFWMLANQFLKDMRAQRLRTFLTIFGITWGTTAVILLLAFGKGLQIQNQKSLQGLGERIVIVWGGRTSKPFRGLGIGREIELKEEDARLLQEKIKGIAEISPEYSRGNVSFKNKKNTVVQNLVGIYPSFGEVRNIYPQKGGRFINKLDLENKKRVAFLGDKLKQDLFGNEEAVGKYVLVDNIPFLVSGVMKKKTQGTGYGGKDEDKAFIPATTFATMYGERYINNLVFKLRDARQNKLIKDQVYKVLGEKYQFAGEHDREALSIWDTTETDKLLNYFFLGFRVFLGIIGTFTLIVGGIGVSNIMNIVVEERTKEIGIKMSLGAKRRHILAQFIFETLLITFLGGILGFLFSGLVVKIFPLFRLEKYMGIPEISLASALIAVTILGTIGLLSGYFPARRAANLNPVQALKF